MKRKRKQRKPEKGAAKWLVTYSDMVTLILVFFIIISVIVNLMIRKSKVLAVNQPNSQG